MLTQKECLDPKGNTAAQWLLDQSETARKILESDWTNRDAISAINRMQWFLMNWKLGMNQFVSSHKLDIAFREAEEWEHELMFMKCTDDLEYVWEVR